MMIKDLYKKLDLYSIYCLERLSGQTYLALNRGYKPLGVNGEEWVNYADYKDTEHVYIIPEEFISHIAKTKTSDSQTLFLYDDNPAKSMQKECEYFNRLSWLKKCKISQMN